MEQHYHRRWLSKTPDAPRPYPYPSDLSLAPQNNILKAVISESNTDKNSAPAFKFAVNSTIVQHLVPTSSLHKSQGTSTSTGTTTDDTKETASSDSTGASTAIATDGKQHVGRRGMHSAQGAYWNEETDGMWSYKYDGGDTKGLDVVIMLIWIAL